MKTMRVLFHNGSWVDVQADFYRDDGDDWVTLRKGEIDNQSESEIVAFFATHLVLGVVQPEMLIDRKIIPDDTGSMIELYRRVEILESKMANIHPELT